MSNIDKFWMQHAYNLALQAQAQGEIPIGAVLVDENNQLVSSGWNQVIQLNDPAAHAEIIAVRTAGRALQNYRLLNTTLYVTLEPCCMCAGALIQARIKRLVFASRDFKAGAAGSIYNLLSGYPLNHQIQVDEGILQVQCTSLLTNFFRQKTRDECKLKHPLIF